MEPVKYTDLYQFHFLSDIRFSPDGAFAVFARGYASEEKNGYKSEVWLMDIADSSLRKLTTGGEERAPFWLDEKTVIFVADREKKNGKPAQEKKKKSIWYKIRIDGGEAEKYLEIEEKITGLKVLDEGRFLVTSPQKCVEEPEEESSDRAKEGKDFYVFDELPFWMNGLGVINKVRNTLYLYNEKTKELEAISAKYCNVGGVQLSPDKSKVAYTGMEFTDVQPKVSGLYLYDLVTKETKTIVPQDRMAVGSIYFCGDNRLFFTGNTIAFPGMNPRYYFCDLDTLKIKELPFCDAAPGGAVGTDCNMGGGNAMKFIHDKLYFPQLSWGNAELVCMDSNGNIEKVCTTPGSFTGFDIYEDLVLMTAMRGTDLVEIWSLDLKTGEEKQLTHFNTEYMDTHTVSDPERFTFINRDGIEMEGFVLKPVGYEAGRKYPGVFEMHGGPKGIYGSVFHHEMQCFASQGYFVFFTNPRGSDGRGEDFANITGKLGYTDYDDFLEFYDEVLSRYPDIDEQKVGICGGSYGGFMCNWMIGHTDRFAAAASQRSISSYLTKSLCTDIGFSHNMSQLGTDPWEDFDTVWEHSPLKCAPMAKTPTLFIQADEDYRCWMSDAIQMFTALKMNGVDARIALFHGENHDLSRSGKPQNRIGRLKEIGDWFEKYLK